MNAKTPEIMQTISGTYGTEEARTPDLSRVRGLKTFRRFIAVSDNFLYSCGFEGC